MKYQRRALMATAYGVEFWFREMFQNDEKKG
jgi:hypothetical protein